MKILFFNLLFILLNLFHYTKSNDLSTAPYIKDLSSYEEYTESMKNNKLKYGFLLFYSNYCHHCFVFKPKYITLSEIFHDEFYFFSIGQNFIDFKKEFSFRGVPTVFFNNNGNYIEYMGGRGVSKISKFIRKYISHNCTKISYENLKVVYVDIYQNDDRNLIIGFFKDKKMMKSFSEFTNDLKNDYIDLCYYVNISEYNNQLLLKEFNDAKENEIRTFSKRNGRNDFIFNISNYKEILFEKVVDLYEDIKDNNDINLLEKMKNKNFIAFIYDDDNDKNKYIETINDLYKNMSFEKFYNFYYVLINKNCDSEKFKNYEANKVYHISNDFKNHEIINDLPKFIIERKILFKESNISKESESDELDNQSQINDPINVIIVNENISVDSSQLSANVNINRIEKKNVNLSENKTFSNKEENNVINITIKNKTDNNKNNKNREYDFNSKLAEKGNKKERNLLKIIIILIIIGLLFYILITKYFCVGFIKVYNNQIIEFNSEPNKIEII